MEAYSLNIKKKKKGKGKGKEIVVLVPGILLSYIAINTHLTTMSAISSIE